MIIQRSISYHPDEQWVSEYGYINRSDCYFYEVVCILTHASNYSYELYDNLFLKIYRCISVYIFDVYLSQTNVHVGIVMYILVILHICVCSDFIIQAFLWLRN